ncbi:MAG: hypothetical protein KIS75_14505 [Chromatiales bacterium]|nr:hypothetical protein [Chromatiales bacterium]
MNTKNLMLAAAMTAVMAGPVAVAGNDAPASSAGQAQAAMPASGAPMTQVEMLQRMQDMRRQHMEMMQNNPQGMPAMGPRTGMMNPEMMQQMQDMRQQRMEMMQNAPQGMPPMGPGAGRMSPEMMQQMQDMHRQKMEMMQSNAAARSPMAAQAPASEQPVAQPDSADMPSAPAVGDMAERQAACAKMHRGGGMPGMQGMGMGKQRMMAMKQQHMQTMEQRLANIEALLQELVDLQKAR